MTEPVNILNCILIVILWVLFSLLLGLIGGLIEIFIFWLIERLRNG